MAFVIGAEFDEPVYIRFPDGRIGTVKVRPVKNGRFVFDFPKDVGIYRESVWQRMQQQSGGESEQRVDGGRQRDT